MSIADSANPLLGFFLHHPVKGERKQVGDQLTRCGARSIVVPIPLEADKPIHVTREILFSRPGKISP